MEKKVATYHVSYTGARKSNQDRVLVDHQRKKKSLLLAVADGMGGHQLGDKAAEIVISTLQEMMINHLFLPGHHLDNRETLRRYILDANKRVYEYSGTYGAQGDMGTTLSGFLLVENAFYVFNVGDSRTYGINEDGIHLLTVDHTADADALQRGVITDDEVGKTAYSNVLIRSLGSNPEVAVDIFPDKINSAFPVEGDLILFGCSDGLWGNLTSEKMAEQFLNRGSIKSSVESLASMAYLNKSRDNISLAAVEIGQLRRGRKTLPDLPVMEELTLASDHKQRLQKWSVVALLALLVLIFLGIWLVKKPFAIESSLAASGNAGNAEKSILINQEGNRITWRSSLKGATYQVIIFDAEGNQVYSQKDSTPLQEFDLSKASLNWQSTTYYLNLEVNAQGRILAARDGMGMPLEKPDDGEGQDSQVERSGK